MKIKKKIISGLLTATTLVSLCAFSAGAVSTDKKFSVEDANAYSEECCRYDNI